MELFWVKLAGGRELSLVSGNGTLLPLLQSGTQCGNELHVKPERERELNFKHKKPTEFNTTFAVC